MSSDLSQNIRLLCSYHKSIADVCRQLGVNRSQFNRYLNGQTLPSLRVLRKMCDFFGLEEAELMLPHGQFAELIKLKPQSAVATIEKNALVSTSADVLTSSRSALDSYAGYYFTCYNSMSNPGKILRGLAKIYRTPFGMNYKSVELIGTPTQRGFTCKYEGGCYTLKDRIFITSMEMLTQNEVTQTILYPSYTNRIRYLTGIMSGVAAHATRPPAATQIVFEYLGETVDIRRCLKKSGLFEFGGREISEDVQRMISAGIRPGSNLLEAAPG